MAAAPELSYETFYLSLLSHSDPSYPISKAIYNPDNPSYSSILQAYIRNLRFNTSTTPKPLFILTALHESHVQAAVFCAKKHGLQMKVRSGGHDYEGTSYVSDVPFFILDMCNLRSIDVDIENETAWVQTGSTLGEVFYSIAEKSSTHGFPAGVCPTVGVGGHLIGGGYGNLMRKYGLSVDNITDAILVDAEGRILDRKSMGEDLFWAIRGGGASFGVVVSYKLNLVRVAEVVTVFRVGRTLEENATELGLLKSDCIETSWLESILFWADFPVGTPIDVMLSRTPPSLVYLKRKSDYVQEPISKDDLEGIWKKMIELEVPKMGFNPYGGKMSFFLGQMDRLLQLMNESFPELGLQAKDCAEMRWIESVLSWVGMPKGTPIEVLLDRIPKGVSYLKRKSDYVKEPISKEGLESIWKVIAEVGEVAMLWNPYGGKMSEISETETAFPHRAGNIFKIQYSVNWKQEGIDTTNHYVNLTRTLFEAMTPYVSKNPREAFLNYRDIDIGTFQEASVYGHKYFKDNFDRLVQIKTRVDPDNFFGYEQSIPTQSSSYSKIL
ncbi:hypothetical protein NC651_027633 [Populus alba x Populus x berolinensis]|nr:hypothetical protein NC651_027633 [Populus alba x Populus x berolinensis]